MGLLELSVRERRAVIRGDSQLDGDAATDNVWSLLGPRRSERDTAWLVALAWTERRSGADTNGHVKVLDTALQTVDHTNGSVCRLVKGQLEKWATDKAVRDLWIAQLKKGTRDPLELVALAGILSAAVVDLEDSVASSVLEAAVPQLLKACTLATFCPQRALKETFHPQFWKKCSANFTEAIAPLLSRSLKRAKKSTIRLVGVLLFNLDPSLDHTCSAETLLLPALEAAFTGAEIEADATCAIVSVFAERLDMPALVDKAVAVLSRQSASSTETEKRRVAALCLTPTPQWSPLMRSRAVAVVHKWCSGKESSDQIRAVSIASLVQLVAQATEQCPPVYIQTIATLCKTARASTLSALARAVTADMPLEGSKALIQLVPAITELFADSKLKFDECVHASLTLAYFGIQSHPASREVLLQTAIPALVCRRPANLEPGIASSVQQLGMLALKMMDLKASDFPEMLDMFVVSCFSCDKLKLLNLIESRWCSHAVAHFLQVRDQGYGGQRLLKALAKSRQVVDWPSFFLACHKDPKRPCWQWVAKYAPPFVEWQDELLTALLVIDENELMRCAALRTLTKIQPRQTFSKAVSFFELIVSDWHLEKITAAEFDVLQQVREFGTQEKTRVEELSRVAKAKKSDARDKQRIQTAQDKAKREAEAHESARIRYEALQEPAKKTAEALDMSRGLVTFISVLCEASPEMASEWTPNLWAILKIISGFPSIENECRDAAVALCKSAQAPLSRYGWELGCLLYYLKESSFLEKEKPSLGILTTISSIVQTPHFTSEGISILSFLLEDCLMRIDQHEPETVSSALALVSLHVKRTTWDAATALAKNGASSWLLNVMEREDGLFSTASDSLIDLAETAMLFGPNLNSLLIGLQSGKTVVREVTVEALEGLESISTPPCPQHDGFGRAIWIGKSDVDAGVSERCSELWSIYDHPLDVTAEMSYLVDLTSHVEEDIRVAAARSVSLALASDPTLPISYRSSILSRLFMRYSDGLPKPLTDKFERRNQRPKDMWYVRQGVAISLREMATAGLLSKVELPVLFTFLCSRGLGDENLEVRSAMVAAAHEAIDCIGPEGPVTLMPMVEAQLTKVKTQDDDREVAHADRTRENLIVCLGNLAGHLPPEDARVRSAIYKLTETALITPSEGVQRAAADSLSRLGSALSCTDEETLVQDLTETTFESKSPYGKRRGAAYCLAGLLRCDGFRSLKRYNTVGQIQEHITAKDPKSRLGGLILLETLATMFRKLFEAYVPPLIEHILSNMGDGNQEIRDAAWQASQSMMAELTGQGVRLLLPGLLSGLKERQWRTKAGSAEVLGAMAFCAPRQLAVCLPQVVPRLAESMADAHPKVKASAEGAISRIAAVARNPEVRQLAPFLLSALKDPSSKTKGALDAMLGTEFIHAVDPASLALLIPPIHRGLRERETDVKKRAAAIVGSMSAHVANSKDVIPYLSLLLPELQKVLLDPIPDARRTAARALGALSSGLSEKDLPGLKPWLVSQLQQPSNTSAERSGAAIGLAEYMGSVAEEEFAEFLTDLLSASKTKRRSLDDAATEEGLLMLLASLPFTCPAKFEESLQDALPIILKGLADNSDNVREAALSAGRGCVSVYGKTNIQGLLPLLLGGLRDGFWRIRQSSTQLLGDFLFAIAGHNMSKLELFGANASMEKSASDSDSETHGADSAGNSDAETDDDGDGDGGLMPDISAEETMKRITATLGIARRNEVIACLYLVRCDVSLRVRQTAIQVWKRAVSNTPRTLKDCLPAIVNQVIGSLAQQDEERRIAGGRALGDLAQKLGDRVLPEVLPVLRQGIQSEDVKLRLGSCEGLGELVNEAPAHQLSEYSPELLPAVETVLTDSEAEIREAACGVFSSLSKAVGIQQSENIILGLVRRASDPDKLEFERACALDGLERVLANSGTKLLALIVPRLLDTRPLSKPNAIALAAAARVAGPSFEVFLTDLLPALVESAVEESDALAAIESIVDSLCHGGDEISKAFLLELVPFTNDSNAEKRRVGAVLMGYYAKHDPNIGTLDRMFDSLVRLLADESTSVVECSRQALVEITNHVDHDTLAEKIGAIRPMLRLAGVSAEMNRQEGEPIGIPGLKIVKGPGPFITVFSHGLLHGTAEVREQAALGITEIVKYSSPKSLGPYVLKLTGALIRVISDRFPWQVKAGILSALYGLLDSVGSLMRTFLPQLQSTFLKNMTDSTRTVRQRSGVALGSLAKVQPRLDPLIKEILNQMTNQSNPTNVRVSFCDGMCRVLESAKTLPEIVFSSGVTTSIRGLVDSDSSMRRALAIAIGSIAIRCTTQNAQMAILSEICGVGETKYEASDHGTAIALRTTLRRLTGTPNCSNLTLRNSEDAVSWMVQSEYETVRQEGALAAAEMFLCSGIVEPNLSFIVEIVKNDPALDARVAALKALTRAASDVDMIPLVAEFSLSAAVDAAMERNTAIKHTGEAAVRQMLLDEYSQERPSLGMIVKRCLEPDSIKWLSSSIRKLQNLPFLEQGLGEADL